MRRSPVLAGGAVLVALAVFAFGVVFPRGREVDEIRGRVAEADHALAQREAELSALESVDATVVERDLILLRTQIPSTAAFPELLRAIDRAAASAGVTVVSFGVGSATASGSASVSVLPLTMSIQGDYFSIARFLFELEHLERLTSVRSISLTPGGDRGLTASIAVEVYSTDTSIGPGTGSETGPEVGA